MSFESVEERQSNWKNKIVLMLPWPHRSQRSLIGDAGPCLGSRQGPLALYCPLSAALDVVLEEEPVYHPVQPVGYPERVHRFCSSAIDAQMVSSSQEESQNKENRAQHSLG